jgi:CheY-like chemotaxis protein
MTAKRALVVDDSKSARTFLSKLLEEQQLEVDAAETAEQAIDYLTRNRPDVIFMDHLMPGMDGFQAVQSIKNNPRTAMIPILMYTSQEGELYLGQARALGAVGVLPKSVEPADVRTVLQQLHLVQPAETQTVAVQSDVLDAAVAAVAAVDAAEPARPLREEQVEELVKDEMVALRRYVADSFETHSERMLKEVRGMIRDLPRPTEPPLGVAAPPSRLGWLTALAASVVAAMLGTLLWQGDQRQDGLERELVDARATVAELNARYAPAASAAQLAASGANSSPGMAAETVKVPFGEAPFAGSRIERLQQFVAKVAQDGLKGTVQVRRYAGRFCLTGSSEGFSVAEGATPFLKCDLVVDAGDPVLGQVVPESVAFANTLAELRKQHAALVTIEVGEGNADTLKVPYPEISGTPPRVPTAAEWNAVAEANNRVELIWRPET